MEQQVLIKELLGGFRELSQVNRSGSCHRFKRDPFIGQPDNKQKTNEKKNLKDLISVLSLI